MLPEQAYKLSVLVERLKSRGLDLTEELAAIFVGETLDFIKDSAAASVTPYDDILKVIAPVAKKKLLEDVVDKIDGKDDIVVSEEA